MQWLKLLDSAFAWEVRMLYFTLIATVVRVISQPAAKIMTVVGACLLILFDSVVSVLVTFIFLRPITKTMSQANHASRNTPGYVHMQRTKWMALGGAVLTVLSSTIFYVNIILHMTLPVFYRSAWLNIFVFSRSLDSILNDVGMLLLSGTWHSTALSMGPRLSQSRSTSGKDMATGQLSSKSRSDDLSYENVSYTCED